MLCSGDCLLYVLSRLETFANPHDAPSDNTSQRGLHVGRPHVERKDGVSDATECSQNTRLVYIRTNLPSRVCARHPVSLSWRGVTALFTYDVPHYRAHGCGFGKFQRRAYTCGKSDRVADRGEEFSYLGGRHSFRKRGSRLLWRWHVPTVYPRTQWILAFVVKHD